MKHFTFKNFPIKTKLILVIMCTSLLGLFLSTAAIVLYDWHEARQALGNEQQVLARVIGQRSSAALAFRDKKGAQDNLDALSQQKSIVLACLYDSKGQMFLASSTDYRCPDVLEKNEQLFADGYLHIYHQILLNNKLMGSLYLRSSLVSLDQKLKRFTGVTLGIMGLVVLLILIITSRVQRIISAPILLLSKISRKVSDEKDYSHRAQYDSADELGSLVKSFNYMMETIESAQTELSNLAFKDALTGLPNRRLFMLQMETLLSQATRSGKSVALFLIDLDGFKAVNDNLGHEAGDWVLITVGQRLQNCLREGDIAARLGGDEFTVLLSDCQSLTAIRTVAEKVCETIDEPIYFQAQLAKISASIGISVAPADTEDPQELMKLADTAMYAAKHAGKNGFVFAGSISQQQSLENKLVDEQLSLALEQDRLQLYVDPQYRLQDKILIGGNIHCYEKIGAQEMMACDAKILTCENKEVLTAINLFLVNSIQRALTEATDDALKKLQSFTLQLSFKQLNHPKFMETFIPLTNRLKVNNIRFFIAVSESDLQSIQNMRGNFQLLLSQNNMALVVDVSGLGTSFINRWLEYSVAQVRFKILPRDARETDKKILSQASEYLNQVLVELCQYLLCDSVAINLVDSTEVALYTRIGCNYGQGLAFSEHMSVSRFFEMLISDVPIGIVSGQ